MLDVSDCGDISEVTTNGGTFVPDAECNMPCSGDPAHACGAVNKSSTYYWDGAPLYVWHKPENTGYYEARLIVYMLRSGG